MSKSGLVRFCNEYLPQHPELKQLARCALASCLALVLVGCGSNEPAQNGGPGGDTHRGSGSAVLTERARVLSEADLSALSGMRPQAGGVELVFSKSSPLLDGLVAGDVLIIGTSTHTPQGALLEVESVTREGTGPSVRTRPAALGSAFQELKLDLTATLAQPSKTSPGSMQTGDVAQTQQALGVTFPFAIGDSGNNGVELKGSLSLDSDIGIDLDFDFAAFELKELGMSFTAEETFLAELAGHGEATLNETKTVGLVSFTPITVLIPIPVPPGTVPVVLTPGASLEVGLTGRSRGELTASVLQEASYTARLGYYDGEFQSTSESRSRFEPAPPAYEASVNLRAWAGPRMDVLLYGAVGPFAKVEAFVELAANLEGPPPCVRGVLDAGLSAKVGIDFLADYETTLFDKREELARFDSCTNDPNAPRPAVTWARTFGRPGSSGDTAKAVIELADGSLLAAGDSGLFEGIAGFAAAAWVLRLDPLGNVTWQRAFQRTSLGLVRGLAQVPGGFLLAGTNGVMKLDSGGNRIWARSYAADSPLEINSLAAQADGSFAVAGYYGSPTQSWVMGLSARGDVVWSARHIGEEFTRVRATADGSYIVVGKLSPSFDGTLVKLAADGRVVWARMLDNVFEATPDVPDDPLTTSDDRPFDVAEKPGGGYVVVGDAYGPFPLPQPTPVGYYGSWVMEVDADGNLSGAGSVVHRAPSDGLYGGLYAVAPRPNGTSLLVGRRADTAQDLLVNEDVLVIQGGSYSTLGGPGNDAIDSGNLSGNSRGMPLALTADGGAILAATSNSFSGQNQFWLVKLNGAGTINFPERQNISGSSFNNSNAQSSEIDTSPQPVAVNATAFDSAVRSETTDVTSGQQNP